MKKREIYLYNVCNISLSFSLNFIKIESNQIFAIIIDFSLSSFYCSLSLSKNNNFILLFFFFLFFGIKIENRETFFHFCCNEILKINFLIDLRIKKKKRC